MLKKLANKYFELFSNKNSLQIAEMFSQKISLNDPKGCSLGKTDVLNATQKIFDSASNIEVKVKNLYEERRTVIAELEIIIDSNELIKIVDILKFDKSDKIVKISAYKM
tara:strand:- start:66 stop:392 length:327 start_codon:yes stop_codon:yes gene_type:complete